MADTVVKTVEDVDKLFSQIVVNGETYDSDRYVPPAPVQVIEEPEPEPQQTEISQNPSVPSGQTIQGEDVYAVVLNDEQHNFVDPEEVTSRTEADTTLQGNINSINALIPSDTTTSNKLVNKSGVQDAVNTAVENAVADLDVPSVGGNGKYIKAISETNGKISATEGTIATAVESGNNNPVTSDAVNSAIQSSSGDVSQQIAQAIGALDVASTGGSGKYISAISETDGKISATEGNIDSSVTGGSSNPVTGGAVSTAITNAIGALDVASAGGSGKYISAISESDGKISATEGTIDSAVTSGSNNPVTSDAVSSAISSISGDVTQQISDAIGALDVASAGGSGKYISAISETDGKISATEGTIDNVVTSGSTNPVTGGAVNTAIESAIASIYKPAGDKTVAQLTSALLVAGNLGNVYNITDSGTTTSDFVEGAGHPIKAGDNVAVVDVGTSSNPSYKFDLIGGFIDLSNYIQKSSTAGLVKNDGTIDTTEYNGKITVSNDTSALTDSDSFDETSAGANPTSTKRRLLTSLWTYIKGKITGAISGIVDSNLTVSRALVSNSNGKVAVSDVTSTELGYLDGVTSDIQTQLNGKVGTDRTVNGHALSADVTVTKSDVGLGDVGNFKAVSTVANQGLTNTEKSNARTNIGAGTSNFSGNYNDLSNKPTLPVAGSSTPVMDGTGSAGSSTNYARADHVHPKDTSKADKVANATNGNFAGLDSNGNITDSGKKASDFLPSDTPIPPAITVDSALSTTSTNPVQNKVINTALDGKVGTSREVNGHALSADVTITKSDIGLGNVDNTADSTKAVASAGKLTTARKVYVKLGTASTTETKDFSGETAIPVDGTLKIANGGTGKTTALSAQNNLLGNMNAVTSDVGDTTGLVFKYVTPSDSAGAVYYRNASYLAKYLNTRIAGRPNLTCSTAGATVAKTVDLAGFVLSKGAQLIITFSNANTVATPTLNVNSTGAKEIRINRTTVSTDSSSGNYLKASTAYYAHYDGSYWQLDTYQVPLARYSASSASATDCTYPESKFDVYCDTAGATAAKVGRCRGFSIYSGAIISLRVAVANTVNSPTLNVQGSGAKTVYVNGAAVSSSNQLSAGLYIGYYDGTDWQLIRTNAPTLTVDSFFSPDVAFSYAAAATAAKTVVMPSYKLISGARFRLYIVNTNTAGYPTLSVNGTTAKRIVVNGTLIADSSVGSLAVGWYEVIYDGTNYNLYSNTNIVTPVTAGGTGAGDASSALTNLGAVGKANSFVQEFRSSASRVGYITITFKSGDVHTGVLLFITPNGAIFNFNLASINTSNFRVKSYYALNSTTGLIGYATASNVIYLKFSSSDFSSIIIPNIKMSEVGNISDDGIKVNISDVSYEAPSGITFKTDVEYFDKSKYYGTCSTSRATNAKVVTCSDFVLETGCKIVVKFTDTAGGAPTSGNITLDINSTGAKNVYNKNNTQMTYAYSGEFRASRYCEFTYDGTRFIWLNYDSNTTYSTITQEEITAGTSTSARLVTPKLLGDNFVKQESGKGLSTNDFTTTLKDKLDGIEDGAQVNTLTGVKGNSETTYRTGNVNITKANIGLGNVDNTADANKSVSSAGKWTTARNISISDSDGTNTGTAVSVDGSAAKTLKLPATIKAALTGIADYSKTLIGATCSTAVGTAAKTVSISGFTLESGRSIRVLFSNGNSAATPTLNVNSTGAKNIKIYRQGTKYQLTTSTSVTNRVRSAMDAGTILDLYYDGTDWLIVGNPVLKTTVSSTGAYAFTQYYANGLRLQLANTSSGYSFNFDTNTTN